MSIQPANHFDNLLLDHTSQLPTPSRGYFELNASSAALRSSSTGQLPDTSLDVRAWHKGVAWVNGFNLGWCVGEPGVLVSKSACVCSIPT